METTIQRLGFGVFGFRRNGKENGKYFNGFFGDCHKDPFRHS